MRDLANILKVNKITEIPNKDRIELATVENWEVIVEKGKYNVGDLVVYIEYDTILPVKPEFEFLRSRCYSSRYNGFRIKNLKMAGVFSQGIVFPLSILPEGVKIKEGVCVKEQLNVSQYDPEELLNKPSQKKYGPFVNFLLKFKIFRKLILNNNKKKSSYPTTVSQSDEINIQKVFNWLKNNKPGELYYQTEKIEGQAATYMLYGKKKEYRIYSHKIMRFKGDMSNWDIISKKYDIEHILRRRYKQKKEKLAIQGEIAGPGIQKNIYGFNDLNFFVYGIINTESGEKWDFFNMVEFCKENNLHTVPIYSINTKLPDTLEQMLDESNGESVLKKGVRREGIVWRSMDNQDLGFKVKSPEYLSWFSKNDKTL